MKHTCNENCNSLHIYTFCEHWNNYDILLYVPWYWNHQSVYTDNAVARIGWFVVRNWANYIFFFGLHPSYKPQIMPLPVCVGSPTGCRWNCLTEFREVEVLVTQCFYKHRGFNEYFIDHFIYSSQWLEWLVNSWVHYPGFFWVFTVPSFFEGSKNSLGFCHSH